MLQFGSNSPLKIFLLNWPHWADSVIESPCFFCLSLALRSHDQFRASQWSSPQYFLKPQQILFGPAKKMDCKKKLKKVPPLSFFSLRGVKG